MRLDDALDESETKSRSLRAPADVGVEHLRPNRLGHAGAIVIDGDRHEVIIGA